VYYYIVIKMVVRIQDEKFLIDRLREDVEQCDKDSILLIGGHFPLLYTENGAVESVDLWGEFSRYTLELACQVGGFARDLGKEIKFVFFVDDHSYEDWDLLKKREKIKQRRGLYKERSGEDAKLMGVYRNIMSRHGFSESDVLRQDQGKVGREDCLYFSEKVLRASERGIENTCAREYVEFLGDIRYFDNAATHLVSFIPQRCRGHVCDIALDEELEGISANHVFMETTPGVSRKDIYDFGRGVLYRKD